MFRVDTKYLPCRKLNVKERTDEFMRLCIEMFVLRFAGRTARSRIRFHCSASWQERATDQSLEGFSRFAFSSRWRLFQSLAPFPVAGASGPPSGSV